MRKWKEVKGDEEEEEEEVGNYIKRKKKIEGMQRIKQ